MKYFKYSLLFAVLAIFAISSSQVVAQDYSKKVDDLNREIKILSSKKQKTQREKKKVEAQLRKKEKEIKTIESRLTKVEKEVGQRKKNIRELEKLIKQDSGAVAQTEKQTHKMVYEAYKISQVNYAKLLLSQNDPNAVVRNKDYFSYLLKHKDEKLRQLKISITGHHQDQEALNKKLTQLEITEKKHLKEKQKLTKARSEREQLVAKLGSDISATNKKIKKLSANRVRLRNLVKSLKKQKQTLPKYTPRQGSFAKQKSRLPYPVVGHMVNTYGKRISGSRLKSNGVTLKTKPNTLVKAIYDGQVIFAKALKGFGNLIIVDHGDSYMSLYAQNSQLNKNVGDIVEAGDTLAKTSQKNNFYFEIRHKGKPVNPARWCKR